MPLTEQAARALEESIAHWERNVAAERPEDASVEAYDCASCHSQIPPRPSRGAIGMTPDIISAAVCIGVVINLCLALRMLLRGKR